MQLFQGLSQQGDAALDQEISLRFVDQGVRATHELVDVSAIRNAVSLGHLLGIEVKGCDAHFFRVGEDLSRATEGDSNDCG